ncbi:MAG: phage tail protein [Ruminiclostridium sp.]
MALEQYPYKNYRFKVEIDGVMVAGFNEVTGFDATIDVIEYREGDAAVNTPRKQPGLVKYGNITFKRGVIDENEFFPWVEEAFSGNLTRKTIVINLYDDSDAIVASWQLINAWPAKYTGPDLNGMGAEVAIESIEFAHEGLSRLAV